MSLTYPLIQMILSTGMIEFSGPEIINATLVEEINSLGVELPISTIEFDVLSTDVDFSVFGSFTSLTERILVKVYEWDGGSLIFLGRFYLDDWENSRENRYSFRAIDIVGVMAKTSFDGLFVSSPLTAEVLLSQILVPVNISYDLAVSLNGGAYKGWLPPSDYREALQQICFAIGATVSTARSEVLLITPVSLPVASYDVEITDADKGAGQVVKLLPLVTHISLVSHDYIVGTVQEIAFDQWLEIGSHKIVFNRPYSSFVVSGPGYVSTTLITEGGDDLVTENGDNIEVGGEYVFGPNVLYLTVSTAGQVTITAYPWADNRRGFLFEETGAGNFLNRNTRTIEEATMVNAAIAPTVLNRVRDYYRLRYALNLRLYSSTVGADDIILVTAQYSNQLIASIQKMTIDLTGGYRQTVDSLGIPY